MPSRHLYMRSSNLYLFSVVINPVDLNWLVRLSVILQAVKILVIGK